MKRLTLLITFLVIAICSAACDQRVGGTPDTEHGTGQPVAFVSGGTIDDSVAYLLLTTMDDVDLRGVIITNTDTIADYAMQIQWKMMGLVEDRGVPVGLSAARGWNPFPWLYRSDAIRQYDIEALLDVEDNQDWPPYPPGDTLFHDVLSEAVEDDAPVTLLITCPITPLSDLLRQHPELEKGVARLIWMGGAIYADGNLDPNTIPAELANPKAEWNAFWDPHGVDWLFRNTSFPIVLFTLDVTDQVPVTEAFMQQLDLQAASHRHSELVHLSYALTSEQPFYRMWNTVTTAYLAHPDFFEAPVPMNLEIETEGYDQGTIRQSPGGRQVDVVLNMADRDAFYEYVLEQFRRDFAR
jgi:purine nucleosidase